MILCKLLGTWSHWRLGQGRGHRAPVERHAKSCDLPTFPAEAKLLQTNGLSKRLMRRSELTRWWSFFAQRPWDKFHLWGSLLFDVAMMREVRFERTIVSRAHGSVDRNIQGFLFTHTALNITNSTHLNVFAASVRPAWSALRLTIENVTTLAIEHLSSNMPMNTITALLTSGDSLDICGFLCLTLASVFARAQAHKVSVALCLLVQRSARICAEAVLVNLLFAPHAQRHSFQIKYGFKS